MKFAGAVCLVLILFASQSSGVEIETDGLPSSMPTQCNPYTCEGCTPYLPSPGIPADIVCGGYDGYFPVPVKITKNDLSSTQDLAPQQWVCLPCCAYKCGFNDNGSKCAEDAYGFKVDASQNDFGCSKCASNLVKNTNAGFVKTSFETLSTKTIYSVINQQFSSCVPPPPPSANTTSPTLPIQTSPTAVATPPTSTTPAAVVVVPTATPVAVSPSPEVVAVPPTPVLVAPVPAPAPAPEVPMTPPPFVPVPIATNTTPAASSAKSSIKNAAISGVAVIFSLYML